MEKTNVGTLVATRDSVKRELKPVVLNGVKSPKLSPKERAILLSVLNAFSKKNESTMVQLTYEKQTNTKRRIAGENFTPLKSLKSRQHLGEVVKVSQRKDGEWGFTILDFSRMDTKTGKPQFTAFRLSGLTSFSRVCS